MSAEITKAQQGLARKAQAHPQHQFQDLYFLLCKREWIETALQQVLANTGARSPGIDGMNWKTFHDAQKSERENEAFQDRFVEDLQADLKAGRYHPIAVRRVEIPKPGTNKKRPLGIQTIKDRVVQTLLKMLLEPIWEADFLPCSQGFRPTRCTMDCIQPLYTLFNAQLQYRWVIEGDIKACFSEIPHAQLLREVRRRVADTKVLRLIARFLKSGVMDRGKFAPTTEGVTQGGPLSPLLANIYGRLFGRMGTVASMRP